MYQPEFKMIWPSSVRDLSDAKKTDSSKGLVIRKVRLIAEFFESIVWLLLLLKRYSKSEVSNSWAIFLPDNSVMILLAILGVLMVAFKKMRPSLGVGNFAMFTKESFTVSPWCSAQVVQGEEVFHLWKNGDPVTFQIKLFQSSHCRDQTEYVVVFQTVSSQI